MAGDFLHSPALDDEAQHISLAPGELDVVTTRLIVGGEDILGHGGREIRTPVQHFVDRVNQLVPRPSASRGMRTHRRAWPWRRYWLSVHGQDHELAGDAALLELLQRLQPADGQACSNPRR